MDIQALEAYAEKMSVAQDAIMAANPDMSPVTAICIAQDQVGAERVTAEFESGERKGDPSLAWLVGSFARWTWAMEHSGPVWVRDNIAELWRSSDPDDTAESSLAVWKGAWAHNKGQAITDGKALPNRKWLTIYRGQMPDEKVGIAWSLDYATADKFARGAGVRVHNMPGAVIRAKVRRDRVLGYLTGRNEAEIICDPADTIEATYITRYQRVKRTED